MLLPAMSPSNLESRGSIAHWFNPSAQLKLLMIFACDQLRKGKADLILTGGVDELSEFLFRGFSELHFLATDQGHGERSCPYDQMRNGLVLGEGAGILVVENRGTCPIKRGKDLRLYFRL